MKNPNELASALKEEKEMFQSSKDISEISEEEKDTLRSLIKEGLL